MGSWSVSCGISNIAITSGNDCVILPLKRSQGLDYQEWQPATLPIFGQYNDYGGMENIIQDENTKLIEEHFGVTIDEFVEFLVDGEYTYNRSEAKEILNKINKKDRIEDMRFMWIDRQVYDYMSQFKDEYYEGYNDYGTPEFMEAFGFTLIEDEMPTEFECYDPKRFKYVYRKGDVTMFSDGSTLYAPNKSFVYHFGHGNDSSIETYFDIPEDLQWVKNASKASTWRIMGEKRFRSDYGWILGTRYDFANDSLEMMLIKHNIENNSEKGDEIEREFKDKEMENIHKRYFYNLETFGDDIVKLIHFYGNLNSMSGEFRPHVLYLTPQCGDHKRHQEILDKFCEINRSYLREY